MTSVIAQVLAPLASPRPPPPEDALTASQWKTLMAVADTVIPCIQPTSKGNPDSDLLIPDDEYEKTVAGLHTISRPVKSDVVDNFLREKPSDRPEFREFINIFIAKIMNLEKRNELHFVLNMLNSRMGALLFAGSTRPFEAFTLNEREAILQSWIKSYLPPPHAAYAGLTTLVKLSWARSSPNVGPAIGFPSVPINRKAGKGFYFKFMNFKDMKDVELETDAIVIGSSCGGSVTAKNLAEAGHKVVVVEKAYHHEPEHLPMAEWDACTHLYENGGVLASDDSSVNIIAGSCWGGGGSINWSASLQTQGYVRKEWANEGLTFFEGSEYQDCLDRVCDRMGVSTKSIRHNPPNETILEGSRKLGWAARDVPQNTGHNEHYCGYCTLGCSSVEKKGPVASFLPDAAKAGAKFIEGFEAKEIIFEDRQGVKAATGVKGVWTDRDANNGFGGAERGAVNVTIKAKKVVCSAGTLWSPVLLLNSGLKNPQIGRNFHCHPVTIVFGVSNELINPWEGGILTTVCTEFENLDGKGHGAKIEVMTMIPGWYLTFVQWNGGLAFKEMALKFKHAKGLIAITRDRDSGRIYPDTNTKTPRVAYNPSAFDRGSSMEGALGAAKILYVTGSQEIHVCTAGVPPFIRGSDVKSPSVTDPKFVEWLALVKKTGLRDPASCFGTAHQMGSCRMGVSERSSVVDPKGKVWGTEGLYVADASVFPSASGVNPMITNMAISDYISRNLAEEMKG
ncbi:MAG: hypothetical protein M1814_001152 [Vezdaea aestivalis]|nr:MAG: hypothetical protein M1814_001152 [Vezdaea aestivalis]